MTASELSHAEAWGLPRVVDFFDTNRASADDIYPSEWHFLGPALHDGMRVLDVGCAQGGLAAVLDDRLAAFEYTGLDISAEMIGRAREKHPDHTFHHVAEADFTVLGQADFDLVLVLGILHLHERWRETLAGAWTHVSERGAILFDLRESPGPTIEDKTVSYFKMDFNSGGDTYGRTTLPYNIINSAEALGTVCDLFAGARRIAHYGYFHPVSPSAVSTIDEVMTNSYFVER